MNRFTRHCFQAAADDTLPFSAITFLHQAWSSVLRLWDMSRVRGM
jgi:hypothetical protein